MRSFQACILFFIYQKTYCQRTRSFPVYCRCPVVEFKYRQQCQNVPRQACHSVQRQQCQSVPREQWQQVPKRVPEERCSIIPRQICKPLFYLIKFLLAVSFLDWHKSQQSRLEVYVTLNFFSFTTSIIESFPDILCLPQEQARTIKPLYLLSL